MEYVIVGGLVVGAVDFVKAIADKEYRTAAIIGVAAGVGAVCGLGGVEGLNLASGIVTGIAASGAVSVAKRIGTH